MEVLATKFDAAVVGRNNRAVTLHGMVHALRDLGGVTFLTLRTREGLVQCVCPRRPEGVREECAVSVSGLLRPEPRAPGGAELAEARFTVLSRPAAPPPVPLSKKSSLSMDTELSLRPVTLRAPRARAVFRIQAAVCRAFREFLQEEDFTEIHTPKLGRAGAEGGSSQFRVDYFGRKAVLAQSPQLYKQVMVGVFERVYEIGPVFRAEKHATQRHLNEYTSLDLEMGFLRSFTDLMALEQGFLRRSGPARATPRAGPAGRRAARQRHTSRPPDALAPGGGRFMAMPVSGDTIWSRRRSSTSAGTPRRCGAATSCSSSPLPRRGSALLHHVIVSGRSPVHPLLRSALPGGGDHHRGPAYPQLRPAGGKQRRGGVEEPPPGPTSTARRPTAAWASAWSG